MVDPYIYKKIPIRTPIQLMVIFIFIFLNVSCKRLNRNVDQPEIPEFNIKMLNTDSLFNTRYIPSGNPFVLLYFGPFCEPSRKQMDNIIKNINLLKIFKFYLISNGDNYDTDLFYKHYKLKNYSNIMVGLDSGNFFPKHFHITGTPCMVIYGKDRKMRNMIRGGIYGREIKKIADE